MRPILNKDISVEDFTQFYWLKEELQAFCRERKLRVTGNKRELTERIKLFLKTGNTEQEHPKNKTKRKQTKTSVQNQELSLDTVISENHKCSQNVRGFFKSVAGPKFHFSTALQNYFKENAGKTYRDAVSFWKEEQQKKLDPAYKTKIGTQFEFNQFFRDFYLDEDNKGKPREEVIAAWNKIKKQPGSNKYRNKHQKNHDL
ncbi:DUF6434 domain-containing protein [Priestia filamentosa]|uniref:DUF6434 domain-containing protein n=1 Tax=Priestia filamentosa TaxID=1402861 RepID=UPI003979928D